MRSHFYLYVYIDPRTDEPRYIGKGHGNRDTVHLKRCNNSSDRRYDCHFYQWLRKLIREKREPVVRRIFEHLTEDDAFMWERFYIYAIGRDDLGTGPLCNHTNGGDGTSGWICTDEMRVKKSIDGKRRFENKSEREKVSERSTRYWVANYDKQCAINKLSWDSDYRRAQASIRMKKRYDTRKSRTQASKIWQQFWSDPEKRAKQSHTQIERCKDPIEKARRSACAIRSWADPDTREKRIVKATKAIRHLPPKPGKFKGVFSSSKNRYKVIIAKQYCGVFPTKLEAAKAYNDAVDLHWNGDGWKNRVENTPVEVERRGKDQASSQRTRIQNTE